MNIYNFMSQKYHEYQNTGESSINFPDFYEDRKRRLINKIKKLYRR